MKELISKELLSLVLGYKIYQIGEGNINLVTYWIDDEDKDYQATNKDTLTRLCKEWCLKYDYTVISKVSRHDKKWFIKIGETDIDVDTNSNYTKWIRFVRCDTELEAVIAATKWVMENRDV